MPRSPSPFRQSDIIRAIKAARRAGEERFRVEVTPEGNLNVIVGDVAAPPTAPDDPYTQWKRQHDSDKVARARQRDEAAR
jgi:hypothetical protein